MTQSIGYATSSDGTRIGFERSGGSGDMAFGEARREIEHAMGAADRDEVLAGNGVAGDEGVQRVVPFHLGAGLGVEVHGRLPAARRADAVAGDAARRAGDALAVAP